MNHFIEKLYNSFQQNYEQVCLMIDEKKYTYSEILYISSQIRHQLQNTSSPNIGIYLTYDAPMYASILAIWFEGKTYVPIHPDFPLNKNLNIIQQAEINTILSSVNVSEDFTCEIISTTNTFGAETHPPKTFDIDDNAYILFTSGSTGNSKGVPISFSNLFYFTQAYYDAFGQITSHDTCLQMFELTFDMSVVSYLMPWLNGAAVVGLHNKESKFLQILDLLETNKITVAQMVPSILNLIIPYLDPEIKNNSLRTVFFAGEPLLTKLVTQWKNFVPNAKIYNAYGPTENTIVCTYYKVEDSPKERNGILSIGKSTINNKLSFLDDSLNEGELLLSGKLLTKHYWKNKDRDKEAFLEIEGTKFYKTGDWCERDSEGNYYYKNRIDFQAKINGFRVELSEIEHFANIFLQDGISIAMVQKDKNQNDILILFVNELQCNENEMIVQLQKNLPEYMIPSKIIKIDKFPLNTSGKIDRSQLKKHLQ